MTRGGVVPLLLLALLLGGITPGRAAEAPPGATPFELTLAPLESDPYRVKAWERDGTLFLSAGDMALLVGAVKYWRSDLGRMTLVKDRHEGAMMDGSSLALVDGEILQLSGAAFLWEGRMWLPLDFLFDEEGASRVWVDVPVFFSREERSLAAKGRAAALVEARLERDLDGWHLILATPTPVRAVRDRTERSRFVLRLPGVQYDPLLYPLPSDHAGFQDLDLRNLPDGLQVSFTPAPQARGYRVGSVRPHGVEIVLGTDERDLRAGTLQPFDTGREQRSARVRRVLLRPGRERGSSEAQVTEKICRRAGVHLERNLGLDVRIGEGGGEAGDLILAVHVHPRPGGPAAFVQPPMEGEGGGTSVLQGMGFLPAAGAGEALARPSRLLAQSVVDAAASQLGEEPRTVTAVHVPELSGVDAPAALIEFGGGASGWNEERLDRAAAGIAEGIRLCLLEMGDRP
jgi:hypothetical protein